MGCFSPDQPPDRNYAAETEANLNAQIALNPQLASSNLEALNRMLMGTGGQPGVIQTYTGSVTPALTAAQAAANTASRSGDIADIRNLGPAARDALMAANPDNAALLNLLNAQAVGGLQAGTSMTPEEARQVQQASRAAFAARGTSGGNASIADELLQQFQMGQQLLRQRQQFALQTMGANQAIYDPSLAILGRPSSTLGMTPGFTGAALDQSQIYNPESAYAGNIYNSNAQMNAMFADPSTISKVGAVSNMAGQFIGAVAGAMI